MQRRSSIGSSRASSLRIENRSSSEQYRRSSSIGNDIYADFRVPCKLCSEPINAGTMVNAAGYSWHADCFVCKRCTISLTDSEYHKHNDELLCEECMAKSTGACELCHEPLGNSYVISNNSKYHPGCFICSQCSLPLGTKENYTVCEEGQIICDNCHQNNMMSLISNERSVETRWGNITTEILPDGQIRVSDISDCSYLKRNDIIVAVNGAAVDTAKMSDLRPDSQVTLTVSSPGNRSRVSSDADVPLNITTPPSPPPPSTRPHKRRLLKSLSTSPPPTVDNTVNNHPSYNYIFKPSQVEIGAVIGCGFFGRVCEARLLETGERLCLKELQHVDTASAKAFIDEVALLKNLKHANVLAFKGIVSSPPTFSLLTEYVGGGTLRSLIKAKDVPIPWSRRLDIALDVSSGMSYLHSKEIIHRDLTSKNCLLHLNGTVVVADFGLAQYQQASHYNHISYLCPPVYSGKRRNNSVGAVYWRAPEMIFDKPYDYKVDVFSYGIVMCELVARIKADPDILPRNITDWGLDEARFRELVPPDCPSPFLSVVIQCCCTVPELRPNFAKISDFLHQFIGSEAAEDYNEVLFSITRTLHSIFEDD